MSKKRTKKEKNKKPETPEEKEARLAKEKKKEEDQERMADKRKGKPSNNTIELTYDLVNYYTNHRNDTSTTRQSNAHITNNPKKNKDKKGGSEMSDTIEQITSRIPNPGAETSAITFSEVQSLFQSEREQRIGAGSGNKQLIEAMSQQSEEITTAEVLGRKQTPGQIQAEAKDNALKKAEAKENPTNSNLQESKTGVSFASPIDMDVLTSKFTRFAYFYITHLLGISFFALLSTPAYLTGVILTPPFLGALFICELFFTQILINKDE